MVSYDFNSYWASEMDAHSSAFTETRKNLAENLEKCINACAASVSNGGKILFIGNGGSASDAQHLATEMTVRFIKDRKPISAIALTTDTSTLTAAGNDLGFEYIFSRQVEAIGNKNDVLIGISTSGNSDNVLNAFRSGRKKGLICIGFAGRDGGKMKECCDICLIVPSPITARIQEMHILLGHILCGALEQKLDLLAENP